MSDSPSKFISKSIARGRFPDAVRAFKDEEASFRWNQIQSLHNWHSCLSIQWEDHSLTREGVGRMFQLSYWKLSFQL